MNRTDVPSAFREMWETRPARPRDDRQVAGVASAIARRYDLDPTLVRIAFVVAAFSGVGAALYIAGAFVLPDTPGERGPHSHKPVLVIGLVVAALVSVGSFFDGHNGNWFLALLAVAALLFLLHRSRGDRVTAPPAAAAPGAEPTVSLRKDGDDPTAAVPPAWDPLGAAPFAWDLPEPSPAPEPVRARRAPVTPVTLGLALLAGAATAAVLLLTGRFGFGSVPLLLGVGLAVVGLGLVVGAFLHAGRGLIPFALVLSALTWGALSAPLDRVSGEGLGDLQISPVTVTALQPAYRHGAGDVTLDLRRLDLSTPTGDVPTEVDNGFGDVEVLLPPNADVRFTGDAGLGDITFDGQDVDGDPGAHLVRTDLGEDGLASGRTLVLDVRTGAGDVEVRRG